MKVDGPAVATGGVSPSTPSGCRIEHALVGRRWPFRQVAPLPRTGDEDADRTRPLPATGSGEVLRQPVEGLLHHDSGAFGGRLDMGPGADGQADIDAAAPQDLVLFDHLFGEPILPAVVQQDRNINPLQRLTQPLRSPNGVLGIGRRQPFPVRHPAARENRFLGPDER